MPRRPPLVSDDGGKVPAVNVSKKMSGTALYKVPGMGGIRQKHAVTAAALLVRGRLRREYERNVLPSATGSKLVQIGPSSFASRSSTYCFSCTLLFVGFSHVAPSSLKWHEATRTHVGFHRRVGRCLCLVDRVVQARRQQTRKASCILIYWRHLFLHTVTCQREPQTRHSDPPHTQWARHIQQEW